MEATASLGEDHRTIEMMLPALERMARQFEAGQFVRGYDLARVLEFLREFVDGYHHWKEEHQLFPALEAHGISRDSGPISELLEEHERGRNCVRVMMAAMAEEVGEDPGAEADFARYAGEYLGLLRMHIQKEERELWPLAAEALTAEDDARLTEAYAKIEHEVIGDGGRERFREMAKSLGGAAEE